MLLNVVFLLTHAMVIAVMKTNIPHIFNRRHVRQKTARFSGNNHPLIITLEADLQERLQDIKRSFKRILIIGKTSPTFKDKIKQRYQPEIIVTTNDVVFDEEALPFKVASFDLILTVLNLHTVNDLPGTLTQLKDMLIPDGALLGVILGGDSLHQLRDAWMMAELNQKNGITPRVAPLIHLADMGRLLQRAGFNLPVIDIDHFTLNYKNMKSLFLDLKKLGCTNALAERTKAFTAKLLLQSVEATYVEKYKSDDQLPATVELIHFMGWSPAANQPKALRPGSATVRLADVLGAKEKSAGEKSNP